LEGIILGGKMKKGIMYLVMGLFLVGIVSAGIVYKDLVAENLLVSNHLRSDGHLEINGDVKVDEAEGWTGTCEYDLVVRDGIVIGCEGGEK
jgi:hypothetical protein